MLKLVVELVKPEIIYEDEYLMVLFKPFGWIVNDAVTAKRQNTLQSWLSKNFDYPLAKNLKFRSGIVHRLDKETSGILLVAKTTDTFESLQRQFKERIVKKTYLALVHGKVESQSDIIKAPLGRLPWRKDRFGILPGGREAVTEYKVLEYYQKSLKGKKDYYSLLELYPKTGRTHQIRVHLKHINHPIVGDEFYAGRKTSRRDRLWCPRLFLHALKISFLHPVKKAEMEFESQLPPDLKKVQRGCLHA